MNVLVEQKLLYKQLSLVDIELGNFLLDRDKETIERRLQWLFTFCFIVELFGHINLFHNHKITTKGTNL